VAARSPTARASGFPVRRAAALAVLLLMAALYVSPVQKYLRVQRQLAQQQSLVQRLQADHRRLTERVAALRLRPAIVQCARQRGWVFPGETTLIVTGLPTADDRSC
jgi:cell division protein FtsB